MAVDATTPVYAVGTFTVTDNFDDTETITIGGKAYTINATVGTADGSIHLGANAEGTLANLYAAINLDNTAGELGTTGDYGTSMVINPYVRATAKTATTLVVTSKTPGAVGNLIATTDTHGEGSWGAAVLESGAGHVDVYMESILSPLNQVNSELMQYLAPLTIDSGD